MRLWKTLPSPYDNYAVSSDGTVIGSRGAPLTGQVGARNPTPRYVLDGTARGGRRLNVTGLHVVALAFTDYGTNPDYPDMVVIPLNGDPEDIRPENVSLRNGPLSESYTVPAVDYTGASLAPFGPPAVREPVGEPEPPAADERAWLWMEEVNDNVAELLELVGTLLDDNRTMRAEIATVRKGVSALRQSQPLPAPAPEKPEQLSIFGWTPARDGHEYITVAQHFNETDRAELIGSSIASTYGRAATEQANERGVPLKRVPAPAGSRYPTVNAYPRWFLAELL